MFNIVESPQTKELFLQAEGQLLRFDGTPYAQPDTSHWLIIGQASCANTWFSEPGKSGTLHGRVTICLIETEDSKPTTFTMGGTLAYIRNWVSDAKARNFDVYTINERAYSDRNKARENVNVEV